MGIKTFLPTAVQYDLRAKDKLFNLCQKNKIKVPRNILATSLKDIATIQEHFSYPIVVKGIFTTQALLTILRRQLLLSIN